MIKVIKAIAEMKDKIHKNGVTVKGAGGSRFGDILSEEKLVKLMRDNAPKGLEWIYINSVNAVVEQTASGRMLVTTESKMVFTMDGESFDFSVVGVGSDMNDASFAQGKANTYSKRYLLLKLLDLTNDGLDPEAPDQLEKELRTALDTAFEDKELFDKVNAAWKAKYGSDLDIKKLKLDQLRAVYTKIKG